MVFLTQVLGYAVRKLPRKYLRTGFMDSLRITVKAGSGGMGLPRYGGIGGRGGHVYVQTEKGVSLSWLSAKKKNTKLKAEHGDDSSSKCLIGQPGKDLTIKIPPGITVYSETGAILGDLNELDAKLKVATGGIGGCPETGFSGQKGQSHCIVLDLKMISDVGLVGFPNAGKSTLLRAVSRARPKVAAYPFTTIKPQLGIMEYNDLRTISVADLPGLIEGAHANIGMGHKFLKHLDRTKLLIFLIDIQGFQLSAMRLRRTCLETIILLNKEVELYKPDLLQLPAILIVNKMDTDNASATFKEIEPALNDLQSVVNDYPEEMQPETTLHFEKILTTSLINKDPGEVQKVKQTIRDVLDKYYEIESREDSEFEEVKLLKRIKQGNRRKAPVLV